MVKFNPDIPNGQPKLDKDYWNKKKPKQETSPVFEVNIKASFTNMDKISVFKKSE